MTYEYLLMKAESNNLIIKEKLLPVSLGRIKGNRIAIHTNMTITEKKCVLAEELGHYHTTVGNILDQTEQGNRKQERIARLWAYNELVGLNGIIRAYKYGCQNLYDTAEFLEVTEEFLSCALEQYRDKYGICTRLEHYLIFFEPSLQVKKIEDDEI